MVAKASDGRRRRKRKRWILGVGLDNQDGHLRITRGANFRLVGGSKDTHAEMQERVMHFNEEVAKRHKTLDDLSRAEIREIASRVGMKREEE